MQRRKKRQSYKSVRTPKKRIVGVLRKLWMTSRERAIVIKRANKQCENCGEQVSRFNVHHVDGINWDIIVRILQRYILCNPDKLVALCEKCHKEMHK